MTPAKNRTPSLLFSKKPENAASSEHFVVKIFSNRLGRNRFGVVVGTRVDKRSSKRHFWKRFVLGKLMRQENLSTDFLITAKPGLEKISKKEAGKEFAEILKTVKGKAKNDS